MSADTTLTDAYNAANARAARWRGRYDAAAAKLAAVEALADDWAEDETKDPAYALWIRIALDTPPGGAA